MIEYSEFTLDNGLRVIVHEDPSVEIAVMNILYDVGSRDEEEERTGFAHLFEHLMFGGSVNIPSYDEMLQLAGGENNAFTSPDITNYYLTLPAGNIETGFWLESDRMLSLSFDTEVLEVQRKVVIEEFKQRYLNQPYGDVWLKLRPLAYQTHPYKWATIGKEISHIEDATMDDVRGFFNRFYAPDNAVLVVAGKVDEVQVRNLSKKWFGPIPSANVESRNIRREGIQESKNVLEVTGEVPSNAIYKVFHMSGRFDPVYHSDDLLSDILGRGKSSRLYNRLVKEERLFSNLNAYVMGSLDPGLLVISGRLSEDVGFDKAEAAIDGVINELRESGPADEELEKVKNQAESSLYFSGIDVLSRAMNLAFYSLSGNPGMINEEGDRIRSVSSEDIRSSANRVLDENNSSVLYYSKK